MKTGIFTPVYNPQGSRNEKFDAVARNTGNLLFWHSLKETLGLEELPLNIPSLEDTIKDYSSFVTTDFIWIQENVDKTYVKQHLDLIKDRPLVPISIGLQCEDFKPDFQLHPGTVKILQELQERCVMGVRGYYTAEILNKYGINNIKVIGCPSMYLGLDYNKQIRNEKKDINRVALNFKTFWGELSQKEKHFLIYGANHNYDFVEQVELGIKKEHVNDNELFEYLSNWMSNNKELFFDINSWKEYAKGLDFSMGQRFHGNVISLWNNIPALFFYVDSRTREMSEFFKVPVMDINEFDKEKPIDYYYSLADYTEYNKQYAGLLDNYIDFLLQNKLNVVPKLDQYFYRKLNK